MTNDDERPLKAGGERATPPTREDRQAIHQREVEAVAARKRYADQHLAAAPRFGAALRALDKD
ncbi:hypothetical protein [Yoonia sp.]|uniref:hypothetical protein n=1 Tax=Yoonia sp. TaxID=2212373 RepID=UPI00391B16C5